MDRIQEGRDALRVAESTLKRLIAEASQRSEWAAVRVLAGWTEALEGIIAISSGTQREALLQDAPPPSQDGASVREHSVPANSTIAAEATRGEKRRRQSKPTPPAKRRGAKTATGAYPAFFRDADALIKVGWSKKGRREYEHRAPFRILESVANRVEALTAAQNRFSVEDLVPLKDPVSGDEVPSYQTYLCIGWLRQCDLLEQHGRQGYSSKNRTGFRDAILRCWDGTARRS